MSTVISVEDVSKYYRLGMINSGTLVDDFNRWWARVRRQPDPLHKIGEKDYGNREGEYIWALRNINFQVQQGEVLGIIGRNGAGKSTILKILARVTTQTSGQVKIKGRIASLLEVGTGFHPELTGRENIYLNGAILGMTRSEIKSKFDEIVAFAEVEKFIDTPVKRYSSGMYVRLAFAVAAHLEPEILIVDEVLAVGDAEFQKKCLGKMGDVAKEGRTVLFVSHNLSAIENLCQNCILLVNGEITNIGKVDLVIGDFLSNFHNRQNYVTSAPHILFENKHILNNIEIVSFEILDEKGKPKNIISTWDKVDLKIKFYSPKIIRNASIVIKVCDRHGNPVLLLSTQPDSNVIMNLKEGIGIGHCLINSIPLTGGDYTISCGLAIPNLEYLCWHENLAIITIRAKDVFNSGFAPTNNRALFAIPHEWIIEN